MEKLKWVNSAKVDVNILFCNYSFGGEFVISSRKVYQTGDCTLGLRVVVKLFAIICISNSYVCKLIFSLYIIHLFIY